MQRVLLFYVIYPVFFSSVECVKNSSVWWSNSIIYQIYPRSFKDSNGDGIGDLRGIISKLEHVRDVAHGVWLSPIYSSPQKDFGYDISNFTDVNPEFGTLKDFDEFVAKAKSLGLRILLDFVPNHTSDQHEWFKKSVKRIKPYDDFYVWRDAKIAANGSRIPPNNWLSAFFGSAWEWNEERGQYYYHQFAIAQPDLNYRSLFVQQEMKNILTFWLDHGVDGFRMDSVSHLFEDPLFRDEPRSNNDVPPNDPNYLEHVYTSDFNETYDVVKSWRVLFDDYSKNSGSDLKLALIESFSALPFAIRFYDVNVDPFNLAFARYLSNSSTANDFKSSIETWMKAMPADKVANWVTGNHDQSRVASRFGYSSNRADQISMLSSVLPGLMIIYNGDEIGMLNRFFNYEETVDPAGINAGPERYLLTSRDPERTPYQWDDTVNAGFSTNLKTWLPVNENYKTLNLANQKASKISHYKVYKALMDLKKLRIIAEGSCEVSRITDKVLTVVRRLPEEQPIVLMINFDYSMVNVSVNALINIPEKMMIYISSVKSGLKNGELLNTTQLSLPGAASLILTSNDLVV